MKKNKKIILIISAVVFALLVLSFVAFILYKTFLKKYDVYELGEEVYFNPITYSTCNPGEENCETFNVITLNDNKNSNQIDLMLNRNLGENVPWNDENLQSGPNKALEQLEKETETWSDKLTVPKKYNISFDNKDIKYNINYAGYKARLITAQELIDIANKVNNTEITWDFTDPNNKYENLNINWLTKNAEGNGSKKHEKYIKTNGYWTSTAVQLSNENWVWTAYSFGQMQYDYCTNSMFGVRPVITVDKSSIKKSEQKELVFTKIDDKIYNKSYFYEYETEKDYGIEKCNNLSPSSHLMFDDNKCMVVDEQNYKTYIYNTDTKEQIKTIDGILEPIIINEKRNFNYFLVVNENDMYMIDREGNAITQKYTKIGNGSTLFNGVGILNDEKFIPICNLEKCGIVDFNDKSILPLEYADVIQKGDKFVVEKDSKYGLVDENNQIILDIEFDGIEISGDYFITVKGQKLQVLDSNFKVIDGSEYSIDSSDATQSHKILLFYATEVNSKTIVIKTEIYQKESNSNELEYENSKIIIISNNKAYQLDRDLLNNEIEDYIILFKIENYNVIIEFYDYDMNKVKTLNIKTDDEKIYPSASKITDSLYKISAISGKNYLYNIKSDTLEPLENIYQVSKLNDEYYYNALDGKIKIYDNQNNLIQEIDGYGAYVDKDVLVVRTCDYDYYTSQYQYYKINK